MGDAAGELTDHFHLLRLGELGFERALLGGLDRIDDRRLAVALVLLDRRHVEARRAVGVARQRRIDRRDLALTLRGAADRGGEPRPVALDDDREDGPPLRRRRFALADAVVETRERCIGAGDPALPVDGGDRHRRVVKEPHEAHFGGALRIAALLARPIEHESTGCSRRAVGGECHLVEQACRQRAPAAGLEIEIEHFGFDFPGRRRERGEERRALARDDVGQLEPAGADLRKIMVEPIRQRRVEIADVARGIDGEEAGRRVIEIIDRVLQLLEHVLLALAVARDIGHAPHRRARGATRRAERAHPEAQPARRRPGQPHFLLQLPAFAGGLGQPIDRLGEIRVADEDALDRPCILGGGSPDQRQIGGIGIEHEAAGIGDHDGVGSTVRGRGRKRIAGILARKTQDPGGAGEQGKHPDHGERRQECQDIGLRVIASDQQKRHCGPDQAQCDEQHHADAAGPLGALRKLWGFAQVLGRHADSGVRLTHKYYPLRPLQGNHDGGVFPVPLRSGVNSSARTPGRSRDSAPTFRHQSAANRKKCAIGAVSGWGTALFRWADAARSGGIDSDVRHKPPPARPAASVTREHRWEPCLASCRPPCNSSSHF